MFRLLFLLVLAAAGSAPAADNPSDAETIARLTAAVRDARRELATLEKQLADPESEFVVAERQFEEVDQELARLNKLTPTGEELAMWETDVERCKQDRAAARNRFDLAIAERRTLTGKREAFARQIEKDQKQLDRLLGGKADPPPAPPAKADPSPKAETPPAPVQPIIPGLPAPPTAATPTAPAAPPKADTPEVRAAREQAAAERAALEKAEQAARTYEERVRVLEEQIAAEGKLLTTYRKQSDQALQEVLRLSEELATDDTRRAELLDRLHAAQERTTDTRGQVRATTDRMTALNEELHATEAGYTAALKEEAAVRERSEKADRYLAELIDPLAPANLARTAGEKLPRVLGILIGTALAFLLARHCTRRVARLITRNSHRGSAEDWENRASTLVGVFRYAANLVIIGGGGVLLLDQLGVPLVPLMGGAAVLGLAVAFGAQNLIRDYFSGFMILTEDQYGINDVVRIGTTAGLVERVTLRVTVLRDLEGILHFIPNGSISNVSNMTHGWSRALFDVPCPHTEDVDRVMDVIRGLGTELRADPVFGLKITDNLEMLGVERIDANASVVRFLIKTRPLQQWDVKREMLRRIKRRFDELGIGIPANRMSVVVTDAAGRSVSPEVQPRLLAG